MLTKETHDLIQKLHADGMPKLRIANQLNLTFHTVNKHVKNPEWKPYKRANVVPGDNDNKTKELPPARSLSLSEFLAMDFTNMPRRVTDKPDKSKDEGPSIEEYEDRMMKSRTGC